MCTDFYATRISNSILIFDIKFLAHIKSAKVNFGIQCETGK